MQAFNNDPQLKIDLLNKTKQHRLDDCLIKGVYEKYSDGIFKGCAVGCTLHSYAMITDSNPDYFDHGIYESFGIPKILANIEDYIFECLEDSVSQFWPESFLSAINVGAELSNVWSELAQWILLDSQYGIIKLTKNKKVINFVNSVAEDYKKDTHLTNVDYKSSNWIDFYTEDSLDSQVALTAINAGRVRKGHSVYHNVTGTLLNSFCAHAADADENSTEENSYQNAFIDAKNNHAKQLIKILKGTF